MSLFTRLLFVCSLFIVLGMGCSSEETPILVKGKVTFQGQPVTEGLVQFSDEKTGRGSEVELKTDGSYETLLLSGSYRVLVSPLYIVDESSGIPDPKFKKVKNIPAKYHSTATSGLSADVSPETANHDFALTP